MNKLLFRSKIYKRKTYKQKAGGNNNKKQISQTYINHTFPLSPKYSDRYQKPIANPNSNINTTIFQKSRDNTTTPPINPPKSTWAISLQIDESTLNLDFVNLKLTIETKLAEKLEEINTETLIGQIDDLPADAVASGDCRRVSGFIAMPSPQHR